MGAKARCGDSSFEILGPAFDDVALKLIKAAGPCSIGQTLALRHQTLEDAQILEYLSPNQLRVIFNVLLTRKILQMDSHANELARDDRFEKLLAPAGEGYPDARRERDREILENGFIQARVTDLCRVLGTLGHDDAPINDRLPTAAVQKLYEEKIAPSLKQLDFSREATLKNDGFEGTVVGLNNLMMVFSPSVILHLRRMALADEDLAELIHPNQLRVLFNIWLTQKIRTLKDEDFAEARDEGFESLLPDYEGENAEDLRDMERQTLNYAFAQARITNLGSGEIDKHKPALPEAYRAKAAVAAAESLPADFKSMFSDWFTGHLMELLEAKLKLITTGDENRVFLLTDVFRRVFLDRMLPKLVFQHLDRNIEVLADSFALHAKKKNLKLEKMGEDAGRERLLVKFLDGDGAVEFHDILAKIALMVGEFPMQLAKAKKVIS